MRWQALFADLEAQLDAAQAAELASEVADRSRRELAAVGLLDRLRAMVGASVAVAAAGHGLQRGRLTAVGADWLLLAAEGTEILVPVGGIESVVDLPVAATAAAGPDRRLRLGYALRAMVQARAAVRVGLTSGVVLTGTLDRVGADFVDLAEHALDEPRRPDAVVAVRTVPFAALALLRSG